ncbi:AraC family transcriptional regulator [Asticcacaulis sp. AND118]|uniref:AraC family transcriptional regulator n=1 Tax=Asticcacaulis sp. AND118 TaxID=2840468 RepID=UPI001CFF69FF|nr:AraC family transcriptional regulator [Asticcacaulis sp. AND118]UDF05599.1 AraC family transcriptional regulator [Asticcacaulis sp. AND118]
MTQTASSLPAELTPLATHIHRQWQAHGRESPIPGLFLTCAEAPSGPIHAVYCPSLCVVVQGAKTSQLGERLYHYAAGKCLIASLEVPVRAHIVRASPEAPYLAFSLSIDSELVADLLLEHGPADAPDACAALEVQSLPTDLIDPLMRLLALCDQPRDRPVLAPLIRREIVWRLLNSPLGRNLRQIGFADTRLSRIGRTIAHIRDHYDAPLNVPSLAALAGMSPATFHRHFKAATALSPVQFQKTLRLQEARRRLLLNDADVTQVGYALGYESPSQFSREYRRLFGAPPGRDSTRIRQSLTPEVAA